MEPALNEPSLPALPDIIPVARIRETPQTIWYRAHQSRLGRDVLLKLRPIGSALPPGLSGGPGPASPHATAHPAIPPATGPAREAEEARAREEMLLLSRLHCDGIVAALNAEVREGWLIQVVELPHGEPLTRAFQERRKEPWDVEAALGMAAGLLRVLHHAHQAGIAVCRLHPEDIFLSPDGRVKLASLEWAAGPGKKHVPPPDIHWTAPETGAGGPPGPLSDLYALGILMAWLLTGREPPASGLRLAREKALEALRAQAVRPDVTELVAKLLDPAPALRFSSAQTALDEVCRLQETILRRPLPRRTLAAAALAAIAALLLGLQFLVLPALRERGPTGPDGAGGKAVLSGPGEPGVGAPSAGKGDDPPEDGTEEGEDGMAMEETGEAPADPAEENRRETAAAEEKAQQEKHLAEVEADLAARGREAMELFESRELPSFLAGGRYVPAAQALEALGSRFPAEAGKIGRLRGDLQARQEAALKALASEAEDLLRQGKVGEAARRIAAVTADMEPALAAGPRDALTSRVEAARKERSSLAEEAVRRAAEARHLTEAGRFEEAARVLEAPGIPEDLAGPLAPERRALAAARSTREAILKGLDGAIGLKTPLRARLLDAASETWQEEETLILDGREGTGLTAHRRGSTAALRFPWHDLAPATLESLAGPGASGPEFKEGLLVLLLGARRIGPALGLLAEPGFPQELHAPYAARIQAVRGLRLGELVEGLEKERSDLVAQRRTPPETWAALRDTAGKLMARDRKEPFYAGYRARLEESFLFGAREALRARAPENLFRGRLQKERDGMVRVTYDFRDPLQARDWNPLSRDSSMKRVNESGLLRGSVRLLEGDPFGPRMRATLLVPQKGYGKLESLGIILGSKGAEPGPAAGKAEAPGKDGKPALGLSPLPAARPAGLAFILGYAGGGGSLELKGDLGPLSVATPAHTLLACAGPLPKGREALWAAPGRIPPVTGQALHFQVQVAPGQILWTVNQKPVLSERGEAARRRLARAGLGDLDAPGGGSLSLLAEGGEVFLESVEVGGTLQPAWIEARLDTLARAELARFLASLDPPAAPAGQAKKG